MTTDIPPTQWPRRNELEVKKESFADLLSFLLFWCSLQYPIEVDC